MSLKIYLLGQFKLQANDQLLELPSRSAQSLLSYLVLNAGVTHRREKLAGLLCPEVEESSARSSLRQALWRIRKSLESGGLRWEEYLQISDISVTFEKQSDYWMDAEELLKGTQEEPVEEIIADISLYQGELLAGFYDEWVLLERERLQSAYHQKMNVLLEQLIEARRWEDILKWGEEWIRQGYAPEAAYRAMMRAHAGMGDQGMVSATYKRYVDTLQRELDLGPSEETQELYEELRSGKIERQGRSRRTKAEHGGQQPGFLKGESQTQIEKPVFVAREGELGQLESYLDQAIAGQGRVIFVTGEAGSGKTALLQEFGQRAQVSDAELIVASGNCNAHIGIGDPYLPFREILEMLAGDVEARWAAGALEREHACRLWNTLSETAQALLEVGPDLIDTFVPGLALVERAASSTPGGADWLSRLEELVRHKATSLAVPSLQQRDLFEQYTKVLQALARKVPLVLVLDDLQWADLGSISLLFHLGRHLAGNRILVVGAYRPEEVAMGREGARHPLESVVNELQRQYGDITLNMDLEESRAFMEALLDSEPNQLGVEFRDMLYRQTHGQPLFTIELLRGMQERGDLVRDQGGRWKEGPALDWETMPARVEAAVAERIGRLDDPLQAVLHVACVEGEDFIAEVVARVLKTDEREIIQRLSSELDRRHRIVRAHANEHIGSRRLSRYRFRHFLFQKYLYEKMDKVERAYLHEDVGNVLEEFYIDQSQETLVIAPQLARHFLEAEISEKAIHYLHQAGQRAVQLSAYQDALPHLSKGQTLLMTLPDSRDRARQELALQLTLGMAWMGVKGATGAELINAYQRAHELGKQIGETSQLSRVVGELSVYHYVKAEYKKAHELAKEALCLAEQTEDLMPVALGHWCTGISLFGLGEFTQAKVHFDHVAAFYNPEQHHRTLVFLRGSDAGLSAQAYDACCLWFLGYPDQALKQSQEALSLARELGHPFTMADIVCYAGCFLSQLLGDVHGLFENAQELIRLSKELVPGWLGEGIRYRGEALVLMGQVKEGIAQINQGLEVRQSLGERCHYSGTLGTLATAQAKVGNPEKALLLLDEAFDVVEETDERQFEAELNRIRAELLFMCREYDRSKVSLEKAIEVARRQNAKSWELRATISLANLLEKQGKMNEARRKLSAIYGWFTEGFDTPDLREAKALLEKLDRLVGMGE